MSCLLDVVSHKKIEAIKTEVKVNAIINNDLSPHWAASI